MALRFHNRVGSMVTLSNNGRTAVRNNPCQEFNNGVVFSSEPLKDGQVFQVKIDRKVNSWSGSIEVGVTMCDPANLVFPTSATGFREGTWVMSGCSIMRDGHTVMDEYGQDLDLLTEGDSVGVTRSSDGKLHIYINGIDQGPAASLIPSQVWAVIDMYGKCAQVSVVEDIRPATGSTVRANETAETLASAATTDLVLPPSVSRLTFHERCGTLVKLSEGQRSAERLRPLDEFNNGVVMTARPLRDDERFEIRIDRLVDKWSGSIEVGITTHNPDTLDFPATMTNMRSGTIMMSGSGILTNGKGTRREYGEFNLDELQEGDRIGLIRKSTGALHYFINDIDQGVATTKAPQVVWGVVDLYGMAVKVTIVDAVDSSNNISTRQVNQQPQSNAAVQQSVNSSAVAVTDDRLRFHTRCGSHAAVVDGQRTALRPNAVDDFNNAVVLTSRQLIADEMFRVRIDRLVDKWAGSIEIGVTTHRPEDLEFPSTMTNIRSGTWMMTGNGVMKDGVMIVEDYGQNLDRLQIGDWVGVRRKENGSLHFYVNGIDQGQAAVGVPSNIYGVIDLYGQAAQATIIESDDHRHHRNHVTASASQNTAMTAVNSNTIGSDRDERLRFHRHRHGRDVTVSADGLNADRSNARGEQLNAIVASSRALRDGELFEVRVGQVDDRCSGALELGVISLGNVDDIQFPNRVAEIGPSHATWTLRGSTVLRKGIATNSRYNFDLHNLRIGSCIGLARFHDRTLHYYVNGVDQGIACSDVSPAVHAIIDLNGQFSEVAITDSCGRMLHGSPAMAHSAPMDADQSSNSAMTPGLPHQFSSHHGKNVVIKSGGCAACRTQGYNHGVLFSAEPLRCNELFEIKVNSVSAKWSGSLIIGLTTGPVGDQSAVPASAGDLSPATTWLVTRSEVHHDGCVLRDGLCPSLERLTVDDRVAIKRTSDGTLRVYVNGCDYGVAATDIPHNTFAVVDLFGPVDSITITSSVITDGLSSSADPTSAIATEPSGNTGHTTTDADPSEASLPIDSDSSLDEDDTSSDDDDDDDDDEDLTRFSSSLHGCKVVLSDDDKTARRISGFDHGLVISSKPLRPKHVFKVRVGRLNSQWSSSLAIGVVSLQARSTRETLPATALDVRWPSWIVHADSVYHSRVKISQNPGPNLDNLNVGQTVGVLLDDKKPAALHLIVDDVDVGVIAHDVTDARCHAVVDVYGQCEEISIAASHENGVVAISPTVALLQDDQEKADNEHGRNEKSHLVRQPTSRSPVDVMVASCSFQRICSLVKTSLGLPDGYFSPDENQCICYCEVCHKRRNDSLYVRHGEPAREYSVPVGWCRFALRLHPKFESNRTVTVDRWHIAYHGTSSAFLRKTLDHGDLLAICGSPALMVGGKMSRSLIDRFDENKPEETVVTEPIVLSPSIKYAGLPKFAEPFEFLDPTTKKWHHARVAFQLYVKPNSYMVGRTEDLEISACGMVGDSSGLAEAIDVKISNDELQWSTKERGSTALCALVIRVD